MDDPIAILLQQTATGDRTAFRQLYSASASKPERIAFDQVHLIKGDTQHNQRLAYLGFPSI